MAINERPYYEIPSAELARWLDAQGPERWWTVDGDPLLTGRLDVPCPGDELAAVLRKISKPLLLADKDEKPEARGQLLRAEDLDQLADYVRRSGTNGEIAERLFLFCWKGSDIEWLLAEDEETSASSARDLRQQQESR